MGFFERVFAPRSARTSAISRVVRGTPCSFRYRFVAAMIPKSSKSLVAVRPWIGAPSDSRACSIARSSASFDSRARLEGFDRRL